jgi:hypothetical protein
LVYSLWAGSVSGHLFQIRLAEITTWESGMIPVWPPRKPIYQYGIYCVLWIVLTTPVFCDASLEWKHEDTEQSKTIDCRRIIRINNITPLCGTDAIQADPNIPHSYHALATLEHTRYQWSHQGEALKTGLKYCLTNHRTIDCIMPWETYTMMPRWWNEARPVTTRLWSMGQAFLTDTPWRPWPFVPDDIVSPTSDSAQSTTGAIWKRVSANALALLKK